MGIETRDQHTKLTFSGPQQWRLRANADPLCGDHMFNAAVVSGSANATRFSRRVACLGLASLMMLSGCTAVKVKLGMKVYLAKIPVASIEASLPKGPGIAPGEKSPLVVTVTQTDGKVLVTEGKGKGKVLWKDLNVTASVVTANQKGIVTLPHD